MQRLYLLINVFYIFTFVVNGGRINQDEIAKKLKEVQQSAIDFPSVIASKLIPAIDEGEIILQEKCLATGNNETFDKIMEEKEKLQECMGKLINIEEMQKEMDEATPKGELDEVFKKYCGRIPNAQKCLQKFMLSAEPCLSKKDLSMKDTFLNITQTMMDFACYRDGDKIALFISEKGPECLGERALDLQTCLNTTFGKYIKEEELKNVDEVETTSWTPDNQQCVDYNKLQKCVVQSLEKCSDLTASNIAGSMFNYIRSTTTCSKIDSEIYDAKLICEGDGCGDSSDKLKSFTSLILLSLISYLFLT